MVDDDEKKVLKKSVVYINKFLKFFKNLLIFSCGFNYDLIFLKSLNFFYFSNFVLFDSIINLFFVKNFFFLSKKILLGKKFFQKSILKKTINLLIFSLIKKYNFLIKLKSGDINFFSRLNNELYYFFINFINFILIPGVTSFIFFFSKIKINLSFRFKISNLLFFSYFNNINLIKFNNFFINKIIIYYMINNNFYYLINFFYNFSFNYLYIIESYSFLYENFIIFNLYDFLIDFYKNFFIIFLPKLIIFSKNFLNFNFSFFYINLF